jgi:hypothetical protein
MQKSKHRRDNFGLFELFGCIYFWFDCRLITVLVVRFSILKLQGVMIEEITDKVDKATDHLQVSVLPLNLSLGS